MSKVPLRSITRVALKLLTLNLKTFPIPICWKLFCQVIFLLFAIRKAIKWSWSKCRSSRVSAQNLFISEECRRRSMCGGEASPHEEERRRKFPGSNRRCSFSFDINYIRKRQLFSSCVCCDLRLPEVFVCKLSPLPSIEKLEIEFRNIIEP